MPRRSVRSGPALVQAAISRFSSMFMPSIAQFSVAVHANNYGSPSSEADNRGEGQNLSTRPSEPLVKSTFPGDSAIGRPRISRSSNVRK